MLQSQQPTAHSRASPPEGPREGMVGRKEVLRTLPVLLALNLACANGISTDRSAVSSPATPGTRDVALAERRDIGNPRRQTLLQKNCAVSEGNLLRVRGGVSRAGAKAKDGLRLPGSPLNRALAVNGVSWAAVVGGVLWRRTRMGPEEGLWTTTRLYVQSFTTWSPPVASDRTSCSQPPSLTAHWLFFTAGV